MKGDKECSIFADDLKRIESPGLSRWVKRDMKRLEDLMHDLPVVSEAKDDHVVAGIGPVKYNCLEYRARDLLGFDAVGFDGLQFHHRPRLLLGEPLTKGRPIGICYFMYHLLGWVESPSDRELVGRCGLWEAAL